MNGDLRKYAPLLLIVVVVVIAAMIMFSRPSAGPVQPGMTPPIAGATITPTSPTTQYASPPAMAIDKEKQYTAIFETSRGKIVCELFPKDAPITVNNLVFLAKEGFYNGTVFHRVMKDFMIQGGDPTATGAGGPGYRFQRTIRGRK